MRCRPGDEDESAGDPQRIAVNTACELIREEGKAEGGVKWSVKHLATEVGLTESHFCRVFKKIMGLTIGEYRAWMLKQIKQEKAVAARKASVEVQVATSPFEFDYSAPRVDFQGSFDSELARDWQNFSGISDMAGTIEMFPGVLDMELTSFEFSPEPVSALSTPAMTDDVFQFLNFEEVDLSLTGLRQREES